MRRFSRESEVLGRLQHPGIAQIYEAGTSDGPHGPQPYFAMELIKGQALTEYATARSLPLKQRLELFALVCDAVHYAHQQGVIHRDLKPANIMVDAVGQPKILDFGVARLTDADVQATRQTSIGEVIGTLQYMSPEQVNADPQDLDIRSDVYSLGVILYELLAGQLPYDLGRKMIFEAARVILVEDPAPLSTINRSLKGDVETIVGKALEKEKSRRYASAEDFASDLRRYLSDEPIAARPASAVYQLRKFAQRNRALVSGLALAALILVAGTVVSVWQAVRATAAERVAESRRVEAVTAGLLAERRRAEADSALLVADSARADALREQAAATASARVAVSEAAKAQAVNTFLQDMLASSDPSNARGRELSVREVLDQAATGLRTGGLQRQPAVHAAVEATIGRTYYGLGLYDQARPHLDSAYSIRRRSLGATSPEFAESARDLGELAKSSGDFALAEQRLVEAIAIKRRRLQPNDDHITRDLATLAHIRYSRGDFADAERLNREALRLTRARHGNTGVEVADRLRALGTFLSFTGRPEEADPLLQESLDIMRRTYGDNHPLVVNSMIALADARQGHSDHAGSEAVFREALPIARSLFGQEHPTVADILGRLGELMIFQRRLEEADTLLRETLAMRVKLLGDQHPDVQLARVSLARLLGAQQRYAEADTLLKLALAGRRAALGDSSPAVAATLNDLGMLALNREDWAGARERYSEALPIWRAAAVADEEVHTLAQLGWAFYKEGKPDDAEPILTDVLARRRAMYGEGHRLVGDSYEKLAGVALARGNVAQAESLSISGLEIRRTVFGPRSPAVAGQLLNVAFMRERQSDTSGAIPLLRESLAITQEGRPETDPNVVYAQQWLGVDLCATGATAEGDSLLRRAVAVTPLDSTRSLPYRVRGGLGYCLMRQDRFGEAEPLLLQSESGFRGLATATPAQKTMTIARLVSLYERWGKPAEAAEWKTRLPQ